MNVKTGFGTTLALEVESSDSVVSLKKKIQDLTRRNPTYTSQPHCSKKFISRVGGRGFHRGAAGPCFGIFEGPTALGLPCALARACVRDGGLVSMCFGLRGRRIGGFCRIRVRGSLDRRCGCGNGALGWRF